MRDALLARLTALDFFATDLALYLNTHPNDANALENYNNIIAEANDVRMQYEQIAGPLCGFRSAAPATGWAWSNAPWPWQPDANFCLEEAQ